MILFGLLFSLFTGKERHEHLVQEPYFWHGLVFATIFNVAVLYAALTQPDWMWMYFIENSENTVAELLFLFTFLYYLPYVLGFYLGRDFKRWSKWFPIAMILFMALTEGWLILHLFDRYNMVGTREAFFAGEAVSLSSPDNPLALVMNGSVVLMVIYFIAVFVLYRKKKRRLFS